MGRNYAETRYSPLKMINARNVKSLGRAWAFETETTRGLEATPLVAGGHALYDRELERRLCHRHAGDRQATLEVGSAGAPRCRPEGHAG